MSSYGRSHLIERLCQVIAKDSRRIIGLMSGMSLDGVSLADVMIQGEYPNLKVELKGTHYRPFSAAFRGRMIAAQNGRVSEVSVLNVLISYEFSQCVKDFLETHQLKPADFDAIGSHGQTLFHRTGQALDPDSTLQIGSPSMIAQETGILTVGNFRMRDIAAGGRGAPLVSLTDFLLFRDPEAVLSLNNLGSISNLTIVTPLAEDMMAFDTGPANMPIDFFARKYLKNEKGRDENGEVSHRGKCIPELLNAFLSHPFFEASPPKSAGYGEFGPEVLERLTKPFQDRSPEDLLRTAVEFSAVTLAQAYRRFVFPKFPTLKRALFSGGGIHNKTLMDRIQELLPELKIEKMEPRFADAKEAVAFALLANETLSGRPGSFPSVTGCQAPTVLGEIAL